MNTLENALKELFKINMQNKERLSADNLTIAVMNIIRSQCKGCGYVRSHNKEKCACFDCE